MGFAPLFAPAAIRRSATLFLLLLLLCPALPCSSQELGLLTLKAAPFLSIPLMKSAELYTIGGGIGLEGEYIFRKIPHLFTRFGLGYDLQPTRADTTLSIIAPGVDAGVHFSLLPKLFVRAFGSGGYYIGLYEGQTGGSPFFGGGAEIGYRLTPSLAIGLGGSYLHYLEQEGTLYQGVKVILGGAYVFGLTAGRSNLKIPEIRFDPVFPVFFKYYDSNPLGTATIQNQENGPISGVKVSLFVNQYMEKPKLCGTLKELKRLQEVTVPLYSLFTDRILAVTEGTKVSAELIVEYTYLGKELRQTQVESLRVYDRNAMTWDDDRKATSFVTARDPAILLYARNVTSVVRERVDSKALNENFRTAVGLFESLGVYGISYVPDNKTPFTEAYQNKQAIDYLQFPAQTLYYKGGDCDDLSILYAALLESVGIRAAFITVPGHIYLAFELGMSKAEARNTFHNPEELVFSESGVWLPVEVTEVRSGFAKAWQMGARQWRENAARGSAALLEVREGWKMYEPVGYTSEERAVSLPPLEDVARRYRLSLEQFIKNEILVQVEHLRELLKASPEESSLLNKLGVLYARYGFFGEAEAEFGKAIARVEYVPSILNLGNLHFLREDYPRALEFYSRAQKQAPDNPGVLLAIARVQHEMENRPAAQEAYAKLQEKDPELASRFAYLGADSGDTARAASTQLRQTAVWGE